LTDKQIRQWHREVRDLLLLVGINVKLVEMREDWSGVDVEAAEKWAVATYLAASDNRVQIPARPPLLKRYVAASKQHTKVKYRIPEPRSNP
jgi:hypothetical protein